MEFIETLENINLLGIKLLDMDLLGAMIIRYLFNFLVIFIIVRKIYYPITNNKDYFFSFFLFNTLIFFVCFLMNSSQLNLAVGFGLFAIFSIFRYRTDTVPIKEMTYLFMVVILGVINAISSPDFSYVALLFTNAGIVFLVWFMEKRWLIKYEASQTIIYEKIELIKPQRKSELLEDLENRTGLKIERVKIGKIDFLQDIAYVKIYYKE